MTSEGYWSDFLRWVLIADDYESYSHDTVKQSDNDVVMQQLQST